jgi:hypothetical protein
MPFEQDVIASLSAQNIKLYAVEIGNGPIDPGMSLTEAAAISGGSSISLNSTNIQVELPVFIQKFIGDTKAPIFTQAPLKLVNYEIEGIPCINTQ